MATQSRGSKWVGNAGLLIGLPRKSLPRDSKGFERIEGYFDHNSSMDESDSDSSETDTEELVRLEKEKLLEAQARKKVVEDARKKAAYLVNLAASKKSANAETVQKRPVEIVVEDGLHQDTWVAGQADESTLVGEDLGSDVDVTTKSASRDNISEQLYSPNASAMLGGSPSMKVLVPSRLSFGGNEEAEHDSEMEVADVVEPRQVVEEPATEANLESTFLAATGSTDTVSLPSYGGRIQPAKHISTSTDSSFHPTKTSTQVKTGRKSQAKQKSSETTGKTKPKKAESKKMPSSIRVVLSDSESERDEALEMLLASDNTEQNFQGLSQLTMSKINAPSTKAKPTVTNVKATGGKKKKAFAMKSTGGKSRSNARKSVTFVTRNESESDRDHQEKTQIVAGAASNGNSDVYMSFDEDHIEPPKTFSPKKAGPNRPKIDPVPKPDQQQNQKEEEGEQSSDAAVESEERNDSMSTSMEESDGNSAAENNSTTVTQKKITGSKVELPTDKTKKTLKGSVSETSDNDSENHSTVARPKKIAASKVEQRKNKTKKDLRGRISETPDVDSENEPANKVIEPPRSSFKNVPSSRSSRGAEQSQWYIPEMSPPWKRRGTTGGKRERSVKQKSQGRAARNKPRPSTVDSNEEVDVDTQEEPAPQVSPPPAERVSAADSSESKVEKKLQAMAGSKKDAKKKGKPPGKSTKKTAPAKAASKKQRGAEESSESDGDLEEWLENIRKEKDAMKEGSKKGGSKIRPVAQPSASSESELEADGAAQQQQYGAESDAPTIESDVDIERDPVRMNIPEHSPPVESRVEDNDETIQRVQAAKKMNVGSKLKKGRMLKSVSIQPAAAVTNDNEVDKIAQQKSKQTTVVQRGKGRPQKYAPTESAVRESEGEDTVEQGRGKAHRSVPSASTTGESDSEDKHIPVAKQGKSRPHKSVRTGEPVLKQGRSRPRKNAPTTTKSAKGKGGTDSEGTTSEADTEGEYDNFQSNNDELSLRGRESPEVEMNDGPQYDYSEDDPESAGENSRSEMPNLTAMESVDVSVLPRLTKRKRSRVSRIVMAPHSKKRKPGTHTSQNAVPDPRVRTANHDTFSMETSGNEEDYSDFDGPEITQSGGGRRYRRLRVEPKKSHTPGVRRSNRTRIAPVRHWENEQLEYDTRRRSGVKLKGLLVPIDREEERRLRGRKGSQSSDGLQDDREFSPLRFIDAMGDQRELPIVCTLASAPCINCSGEPITDESESEVIIHRLKCTQQTSKGLMTFLSLGEKPRSTTRDYDMFFYVMKGKLLFQVNDQEFTLLPQSCIDIPGGCSYCIRNMQHSKAQVFFSTHYIEPHHQQQSDSTV